MDWKRGSPAPRRNWWPVLGLALLGIAAQAGEPAGARPDPEATEFFEKQVRPILAGRCQGCHGAAKQKGQLRLDSREAALAGGATGPAITPGQPEKSLLIDAINYGELHQMPPKSRLPAEEVATLTRWVKDGATWGVASPPSGQGQSRATAKPAPLGLDAPSEFARRAMHWSFQPIRRNDPPGASSHQAAWSRNPIDRFLLAAMQEHGLAPAPEADRRTLIRRLSYDLIGLPPAPEDVDSFLADSSPEAYERLVDRLLCSPHYGERWGRHWLDLVRFAETAGHEFDYDIPGAYHYRDYVIRALNLDLPFDQFVIEQIAGDLVAAPRHHPVLGTNESIQGTGFFYLGEGTHSPVDVTEEQMRRIDNQIDVFGKTFLGLTIACARCHDHKFDPIRSKDYYALAGFLKSARHQQAFIDPAERIGQQVGRLKELKESLRQIVLAAQPLLPEPSKGLVREAFTPRSVRADMRSASLFESFAGDTFFRWSVAGDAFGDRPTAPADFRLSLTASSNWLIPVLPGQAHSGLVSNRLQGGPPIRDLHDR
jgi:hypothetical protein